nr:hypothetical protein [Tanacetum cinerariifolium]
ADNAEEITTGSWSSPYGKAYSRCLGSRVLVPDLVMIAKVGAFGLDMRVLLFPIVILEANPYAFDRFVSPMLESKDHVSKERALALVEDDASSSKRFLPTMAKGSFCCWRQAALLCL